MVILKGKLMRFIIYVDNIQQYMRALQRKYIMLHNYRAKSGNFVPKF